MNKLSKQKRDHLIVAALGTVMVVAALWFLVISPQSRSLGRVNQQVRETRDQVETGQRFLARAVEIDEDLLQKTRRLQEIENGMASGDVYLWFINTINQFIDSRDVSIPAFSREVIREVQMLPRFPYQAAVFSVRGTAYYHDLGAFLADFENAFPYFAVQNLRLSPSAGRDEALQFEFEIVTLVKPESPES